VPPALKVSALAARVFQRRALGLDEPFPDVDAALAHLGYVQIDPINVCGRMHDLILRNRVPDYREGGLMHHLHGESGSLAAQFRTAFEHHLPSTNILVAFPVQAWPHLLVAMQRRTKSQGAWSGRLTPRERELASRILDQIGEHGPLSSSDIDDPRQARRTWGNATLAKATLQKLFFHGRVLISRRESNRRIYDLTERILPVDIRTLQEPAPNETARWLVEIKLRQRRLVTLTRDELKLAEGFAQPVTIEPTDAHPKIPLAYCLLTDVPLLEACAVAANGATPAPAPPLRLLAPLDPIVYDRRLTAALWNFSYTWEVYTPAHKRVRGYYALPVLAGTALVGHVDLKADRPHRTLKVLSRSVARGHRSAPAVRELAKWLGLK
jgi:uncharacterized protein YcaQ